MSSSVNLLHKGLALLRNPRLKQIAGAALAAAILFFMGRMLVQTWGSVASSDMQWEIDVPRLLVSLALLVVARAFAVEAWRRILISLGESLGFAYSARVWFLSNLTRYVPGNLWQVATMMVMVEQKGVSKTNALLSQVIYTLLALAIAGLLGLSFVLERPDLLNGLLPPEVTTYAPYLVAAVFVLLVIFFALPPINRTILLATSRLLHRPVTAPAPTFARGLVPPLFSLAMWITNGIAFYLFISALTNVSPAQLPVYIAMNAGAYWIGYASLLTPSGLGFREGVLAWMLSNFFPAPVAVVFSLITRLWSTAGELLGVVLVWSVPTRKQPAQGSETP